MHPAEHDQPLSHSTAVCVHCIVASCDTSKSSTISALSEQRSTKRTSCQTAWCPRRARWLACAADPGRQDGYPSNRQVDDAQRSGRLASGCAGDRARHAPCGTPCRRWKTTCLLRLQLHRADLRGTPRVRNLLSTDTYVAGGVRFTIDAERDGWLSAGWQSCQQVTTAFVRRRALRPPQTVSSMITTMRIAARHGRPTWQGLFGCESVAMVTGLAGAQQRAHHPPALRATPPR